MKRVRKVRKAWINPGKIVAAAKKVEKRAKKARKVLTNLTKTVEVVRKVGKRVAARNHREAKGMEGSACQNVNGSLTL
jgi:hypothetical protein